MIHADSNEPANDFQTKDLQTGDYTISGEEQSFIIERKEFTDFVNSYRKGKLYNQLNRCIEQPEFKAILLLEGDMKDAKRFTGASETELFGAIGVIVALSNVRLLQTNSYEESCSLIRSIHNKIEQTTHATPVREKSIVHNRRSHLLVGLPGVGEKTAKMLLREFGTPRDVFNASEEELREIDGIGPAIAGKIIDAVTSTE